MKKNKKRTIIVIIIILILLIGGFMLFRLLFGKHGKTIEIDQGTGLPTTIENAEPILFDSFAMEMSGMSIEHHVITAGKTETGAYLEYSIQFERYNNETGDYDEFKNVVRHIDGDSDYYNTLCKLLGVYDVAKWDGFAGKNPPGVLDGESGSFDAVLSDGSKINAYGSNNFPSHFVDLFQLLKKMVVVSTVNETTISNKYFSVDVPKEWIGVVKVRYDESMLLFFLTDSKGNDLSFLIFDFNSYWYGDDKYQHLGILKKADGETSPELMIVKRNHSPLQNYYETLSGEQRTICDTFSQYEQSVIDSFRGINGYELYPEE